MTEEKQVHSLRDLSPQQWKSGIAAWLGWFFDGLDIHLYTLVAAPFVAELLLGAGAIPGFDTAHPLVKEKSSWIQASFLVGWALGGGFFGRVGDLLGRSRALALTILTYALFTGLSFFAQTWWQLLIFRFLAALGIGGEWAVGSALLSETWPKKWRPWIAAVLQCGVNIGILCACAAVYLLAGTLGDLYQPRIVFLIGILPALIVFWIRRKVPEPEAWHAAKAGAQGPAPGIAQLFAPGIRRVTWLTMIVCATSLTAWWAFLFWNTQHLQNLEELRAWTQTERVKLVTRSFFIVIGVSMAGNFFCGWLAKRLGYRRSIALMMTGFFLAMMGAFALPHGHRELVHFWFPLVGFFSGVFGLFTMYLPPLFPVLLRTTGAGFCYNIGRVAAAFGTVYFGLFARVGDFSRALLYAGCLFPVAAVVALLLPEPRDEAREPATSGA